MEPLPPPAKYLEAAKALKMATGLALFACVCVCAWLGATVYLIGSDQTFCRATAHTKRRETPTLPPPLSTPRASTTDGFMIQGLDKDCQCLHVLAITLFRERSEDGTGVAGVEDGRRNLFDLAASLARRDVQTPMLTWPSTSHGCVSPSALNVSFEKKRCFILFECSLLFLFLPPKTKIKPSRPSPRILPTSW